MRDRRVSQDSRILVRTDRAFRPVLSKLKIYHADFLTDKRTSSKATKEADRSADETFKVGSGFPCYPQTFYLRGLARNYLDSAL